MQNKIKYSEKNIQKLLNVGFRREYHPDEQLKKETLELLLQKVTQRKKISQPENKILVGLSVIWIAFSILIFSGITTSLPVVGSITMIL